MLLNEVYESRDTIKQLNDIIEIFESQLEFYQTIVEYKDAPQPDASQQKSVDDLITKGLSTLEKLFPNIIETLTDKWYKMKRSGDSDGKVQLLKQIIAVAKFLRKDMLEINVDKRQNDRRNLEPQFSKNNPVLGDQRGPDRRSQNKYTPNDYNATMRRNEKKRLDNISKADRRVRGL